MLFAYKKAEIASLQIYSVALCQYLLERIIQWYSFQAKLEIKWADMKGLNGHETFNCSSCSTQKVYIIMDCPFIFKFGQKN